MINISLVQVTWPLVGRERSGGLTRLEKDTGDYLEGCVREAAG